MSEVHSRANASRGRSSVRGGRGSQGSGRTRFNRQTNGDMKSSSAVDTSADEGELGDMKRQYASQLSTLKEMFPDWTDVDLVFALHENDGDIQRTIENITEGNVSQFAEIKKKSKDRARSKVKEPIGGASEQASVSHRAGRGRGGLDPARGNRGARPERGRGGHRGGRGGAHATTNGGRPGGSGGGGGASVPTAESDAWNPPVMASDTGADTWDTSSSNDPAAAATLPTKSSLIPEGGAKMTWASIAKPKLPPAPAKSAAPIPAIEKPVEASIETPQDDFIDQQLASQPGLDADRDGVQISKTSTSETPLPLRGDTPAVDITPSKDELTEDNVEALPDVSKPAPTETAASTVASTTATPGQQQSAGARPGLGGYATSALKATTGTPMRSASLQRKIMEQQEAVVMPGNHAVDRAAVQFGSMGLGSDVDVDGIDTGDVEEPAETRTQPPQHSPTAQPRTSLPPAPRQISVPTDAPRQDNTAATTKPAPGLTAAPPQQQISQGQGNLQQGPPAGQQYSQFGRYGQANAQVEQASQKPYEPFGHQAAQTGQFDNYLSHSQAPAQGHQQAHAGALSSAANDYQSYYTSDQQRHAYQNYYGGNYGQQQQQGATNLQDAGAAQQRAGSGFGSAPGGDSGFPTSQPQSSQNRFAEAQNSGQNTPNPPTTGQQQQGISQAQQHMHQSHGQAGHNANFPYNHPYWQSPYWHNYMSQYNGYNQGYGGHYGGKGAMYGQPHHGFGMSPQSSFDQSSSSPANAGGFGQASMHGREAGAGAALGEYGRSGSAQPSQTQQHNAASGGFGGMGDVFGRSQGGFQGQANPYGQQQQASQQVSAEESLKPFGDAKTTSGPSPSILGAQPGRPGSVTNNTTSVPASQSGLPPSQSHQQQAFSGYQSHVPGHSSQYGGLSGLGGHQGGNQSHQTGAYAQYGSSFGSYGQYNRGGWGGNYTH